MKKVILGATGSIGSSLAKKLVGSGEQVHLIGRDEASLSKLANELNSSFTTCDVLEENFSEKIINDLKAACKKNSPEIKVATPYYKPTKNKTDRKPDFYLHETDEWLVFPHELDGLTVEEIKENKPELKDLIDKISPIINK